MNRGFQVALAMFAVAGTTVSVATFQAGMQANSHMSGESHAEVRQSVIPTWPYPPDSPPSPPDNGRLYRVPGSTKEYRMNQVYADGAPDWFPEMHPQAPAPVLYGVPGKYFACGSCHLMNGAGKPDMQSLNGLPVAYMQQQLEDMKNDLRHTSMEEPGADHMILVSKAVSGPDAKAALEYFHSIGPIKWIRVVESRFVPKTILGEHSVSYPDPSGAVEPLGDRIVELPQSYERTLLRDPTSGFVAYVPPGSIAKGKVLVETGGNGRTVACIICHGVDLRGLNDNMPPIAGRSPTATARQIYDFKTGARHGKDSTMMKPLVEQLSDEEIVDIVAYLASRPQ